MYPLVIVIKVDDKIVCYFCKKRTPHRPFGLARVCYYCYKREVTQKYDTKFGKRLITSTTYLNKQHRYQMVRKHQRERVIRFLGKHYHCSFRIRKWICSKCNKKDISSEMHHWFYLPIMMWACTVELCRRCHMIEDGRCKS